jgi:nitroimidazol reductase NimA-like FMN-containing flavoprotein (pyridoxamine 5'-phosphate oxidase superfamily)
MFIQEMSESECFEALTRARLGRLACARDNQPYIVPIYFAYEGSYPFGFLYGFTTVGQKVEWMRSNPLVCVELDDVNNSDQWTSILIFGRYEELPDTPEGEQARLHAHELLQEHGSWWEPARASHAHRNSDDSLAPIFYRIRIDRISGRRASRGEPDIARTSAAAQNRQGWLRKLFTSFYPKSAKAPR